MFFRITHSLTLVLLFVLSSAFAVSACAQTTGRISGVVKDASGGVIARAEVQAVDEATGEKWKAVADETGNYSFVLLPPGLFQIEVAANGFKIAVSKDVPVRITETTTIDVSLVVGTRTEKIIVNGSPPLLQTDGPQLGRVVGSRAVAEFPLASRNFTQILTLSPGTASQLPDSTAVGRNTQAISVNGARVTQNYFQINGIDATTMGSQGPILVAVPAPETIEEFKVQTSLYDASYGRSGGANIQLVTKSGSNEIHGDVYEYFRNEALNANNPFLKAAGLARPLLRRNVFGGILGGPIRKNRAFFFVSYQGARERNAASIVNSISSNVLVAPRLTDDRSAATLQTTFKVSAIDPASLALLNAKLPNGRFVIPTPQANGLFSGSSPSTFEEDQFNTNADFRLSNGNSLAMKFFFANTPQFLALPSFRNMGPNVPGYGTDQTINNRVAAIQDIHFFTPAVTNELRLGYASNSNNTIPHEPVTDSEIGVSRPNAGDLPGLPMIRIAPAAGGVIVGTPTNINPAKPSVTTLADSLSFLRRNHTLRTGFETRYNEVNFTGQVFTRGQIDFPDFHSFLAGATQVTTFGDGLGERSQRAWDYNFFVQDDWKVSPRFTVNLGLRYELDLPTYDTRGRLSTFDPALYVPRQQVDQNGIPVGPPTGGFVQAGNVISSFDLPSLPKGNKYLLRSIDPHNFGPRIGFAYSPLHSKRLAVRGGYGIYYSRATFAYASMSAQLPPMFALGVRSGAPFNNPFFPVPGQSQFPTFVVGIPLAGPAFDRGLRTPYVHQYNLSVQSEFRKALLFEGAYVGARGRNLFRQVAINQAQLATPQKPITNAVTGAVITTNTPGNAILRAPLQGVSINGFSMNESTAESSYDSLQLSLTGRISERTQLLAAYTFAKSIDNASGLGGGAGITGVVNTGAVNDSSLILGNQNDSRANRGVSDFDRTHRFVLSYLWDLPKPQFAARSAFVRSAIWNWRSSAILTAMSGLPIDIVDTGAGSLYGLDKGANPLARPSLVTGLSCSNANQNVPAGSFFNATVFARPTVQSGQPIPSSSGAATASASGKDMITDIGNVGRNCLRGPRQVNLDFALEKLFPLAESRNFEFRAEFFNLFNHANFANPISNLNALFGSGGSIDPTTGQVLTPGNFGRIISTSNNPRVLQFALKFNF
jgi:Carboxypeptidase regulatory-like domain/TonB dependent receptor